MLEYSLPISVSVETWEQTMLSMERPLNLNVKLLVLVTLHRLVEQQIE